MKYRIIFLCLLLWSAVVPAQSEIAVRPVEKLPEGTSELMTPDADLRGKVVETERAIDLVRAVVLDSVLEVKRQRLAGPGGWLAQRLGSRYWEYLDSTKRKYVGTMSRDYKIYDGMGDEYDINIFVMPHLPAYIQMAWGGFQTALERPRGEKPFRFDEPEDYPCPEELKYEDKGYLTIECEVSPDHDLHERLTEVFLPMGKGHHDLENWPQTGTRFPSFGMYGPWCMDCNHNCRPEIHPFEWLWWLDMSENRPGGPNAKSWMFSLMRDDSRRFKDWSTEPIQGTISIPIAIPAEATRCTLTLDNLLFDDFQDLQMQEMGNAWYADGKREFVLPSTSGGNSLTIDFSSQGLEVGEGILMAWSEFVEEKGSGTRLGYLSLEMVVGTIYAGRITVDYR